MRRTCLAVAALVVMGCARGEEAPDTTAEAAVATASPAEERARTAASVANAIAARPAAADSILQAAGFTRASFDSLMYEIAADSSASAAYAAAKSP